MRHSNMTCQESREFVQKKRPIACPSPVFTGQLEVWEKCRFDLQSVSIVDQGPDSNLVGPSCTTKGNNGDTEGGEEVKQEAEETHEELEEELKELKQEMRMNLVDMETSKPNNHIIGKPIPQQTCQATPKIPWGLDCLSDQIAECQRLQNVEVNSTADDSSCNDIDTSATESSAPVPASIPASDGDHSATDDGSCDDVEASAKESSAPVPVLTPVNDHDHDHSTADDDSGANIEKSVTEPPSPVPVPTPVDDHDHSAADDNGGEDIDASATESPTRPPAHAPAPEAVRAAIKPRYLKPHHG